MRTEPGGWSPPGSATDGIAVPSTRSSGSTRRTHGRKSRWWAARRACRPVWPSGATARCPAPNGRMRARNSRVRNDASTVWWRGGRALRTAGGSCRRRSPSSARGWSALCGRSRSCVRSTSSWSSGGMRSGLRAKTPPSQRRLASGTSEAGPVPWRRSSRSDAQSAIGAPRCGPSTSGWSPLRRRSTTPRAAPKPGGACRRASA